MIEQYAVLAGRRVLGRSLAVGGLLGLLLPGLLVVSGMGLAASSSTAFSIGALLLGFGLTVWATTIWIGDAFAAYLELSVGDADWTKESAARAFSVIVAIGAGIMVGSVVGTVGLRILTR